MTRSSRPSPAATAAFMLFMCFRPADAQNFQHSVQPILARHCFSCHNQKLAMAKLDLASVPDDGAGAAQAGVWQKVREKVGAGKMPPAGQPALSDADRNTITRWIDEFVRPASPSTERGRILARRLNRVEYNNTIRD